LAIVMQVGRTEVVLRGVAHVEVDPKLGRVLRTDPDENQLGHPSVIFVEDEAQLTFLQDQQYDCDYSVRLMSR
jgi:hypothetical protein